MISVLSLGVRAGVLIRAPVLSRRMMVPGSDSQLGRCSSVSEAVAIVHSMGGYIRIEDPLGRGFA